MHLWEPIAGKLFKQTALFGDRAGRAGDKYLRVFQCAFGAGGLPAGANPVSGDFSLLSKGYTIKDGQRDQPLERITVAGNFYELLKNIRAFASDLRFPYGPMGSASADAGEMTISGKA